MQLSCLARCRADGDSLEMNPHAPVPRPLILLRLLWRCFFCVLAVVLGNGVLMAVPQAREALQLFAADAFTDGRWLASLFYVLAVLYWAGSAWFVARILLGRQFERDSLGADPDDPFVEWVSAVLPRLLASGATLPLAMLTWQAHRGLGALTAFVLLLFMLELVFRPKFGDTENTGHRTYAEFGALGANGQHACLGLLALSFTLLAGIWSIGAGRAAAVVWVLTVLVLHGRSRRADGAAPRNRLVGQALVLHLLAAIFVLVMLVMARDEIAMARDMGSPAILLCALAGWTLFGGLALTYWPMTRGWPGMAAWLPPMLLLAGSLFETHWVAQRAAPPGPASAANPGVPAADDWRQARPTLAAHFSAWMAQHPAGEPVYVAAVVGGASRAAYWTGSVLGQLEEQARASDRRFAANLYAMSAISGGSLGATAWVADLAQHPARADGGAQHRQRVRAFLGQDHLSPLVARWLFPDLAIRFVPLPLPGAWTDAADRSLGLEKPWVQDWETAASASPASAGSAAAASAPPVQPVQPVRWDQPITALYQTGERNGAGRLPALLLNTVRLEDGQRFVQAPLRTAMPGVLDLLDPRLDTARLSLAQAVHNSARFPYVSPAAVLLPAPAAPAGASGAGSASDRGRQPRLGRLGDGGYHEASGAATLSDLLESLRQDGWLRALPQRPGLWACAGGWPPGTTACDKPSRVVALVIDGEPQSYPGSLVRGLDGRRLERAVDTAAPGMLLPELLAPVFGGLSTRTRLGMASQQRLSTLVGEDPGAFIELRLPLWRHPHDDDTLLHASMPETRKTCARHDRQPSMNWALDACSRARMDFAASAAGPQGFGPHPSLAQRALLANLAWLRGWIAADKPVAEDAR